LRPPDTHSVEGNALKWYTEVMRYEVELKPRARKDLRRIAKPDAARVVDALEELEDNLAGDVRHLTDFTPEYRLRVGDYRVLFEIEQTNRVVVYRVRHRREAYRT
jgi:mRNA interferase RelE/StbE